MAPTARIPIGPLTRLLRGRCQQGINQTQRAPTVSGGWQQWRRLHLYKTARAKTVHGMHKILGFEWYEVAPPSASQHIVDVVESDTDDRMVAEGVSLEELYNNHVKPGHMLYLTQLVSKKLAEDVPKMREEQVAQSRKRFAIVKANSRWVPVGPGFKGKQLGPLKQINIALANPIEYMKLSLDRAYQFVANGSPVEFQIRIKSSYAGKSKKAKKKGKMEKGKGTDGGRGGVEEEVDGWEWMHEHFPHLRPDFILKSMPEGTFFLVQPVKDAVLLKFVVALWAEEMPQMDLTERLRRVKAAVLKAKMEGKEGRCVGGEGSVNVKEWSRPETAGRVE